MLKRFITIFLFVLPFTAISSPLPAYKAFKISIKPLGPNTLQIKWIIAPRYFLYKNCICVTNSKDSNLQIGRIPYPKAIEKINRQGQKFPVYYKKLVLNIPVLSKNPGENIIEIHYQGCSNDGFCYPPETQLIKITTNNSLAINNANFEGQTIPNENSSSQTQKLKLKNIEQNLAENDFNKLFSSNNWPLIILSFLGFGLLLSFTPCVLPMIPVISGVIVGHGKDISTKKAFLLSLSYVLSMSITYGIIGAVIALLGSNLQIIMQSPWIISIFSIMFVLLALSMFDFYEIKIPMTIQAKFTKITRSQSSGHYLSAIILGSMSILVLSPCVSAPLIGALSYIAQTGNVLLGLLSLFFLAFGMGIPLLLIGTSAGKLLPKAGNWMNAIKKIFGVILIGIAIYLLSRLLPQILTMVLWASLCIFTGVYLRPFDKVESNKDKLRQGFAIIFLGYGLLILYGASSGNSNPLLPLKASSSLSIQNNNTIIVSTLAEIITSIEIAKKENTPVILYFTANWCASCHVISSTTLQNDSVIKELENSIFIKVDLSENNKNSKEILNYFHVIAPPTFIFYTRQGEQLPTQLVGEIKAKALIKQIQRAKYE